MEAMIGPEGDAAMSPDDEKILHKKYGADAPAILDLIEELRKYRELVIRDADDDNELRECEQQLDSLRRQSVVIRARHASKPR